MQAGLLPGRTGTFKTVQAFDAGETCQSPQRRQAQLSWPSCLSRRCQSFQEVPEAFATAQVVRRRQTALRRAEVRARLPVALYAPAARQALQSNAERGVAISNRRIIKADATGVTFRYKDYRADGLARYKSMALHPHEFIRRFLIHVLPKGLHRIRHYGLFANSNRADNLAKMRDLLGVPDHDDINADDTTSDTDQPDALGQPCPCCGGTMRIIEVFAAGQQPRHVATPAGIDSS